MRQQRIYLFFISVICSFLCFGQEEENKTKPTDTLPPGEKYGIRAGIDLSRIARTALNDNYKGLEIVADYRVYKNLYAAVEFGNESFTRNEENISVNGSGNYARIGIDYNAYRNWYGMQNNITVGFRYGFASFSQRLNSYRIFTSNNFFPNETVMVPFEKPDLTAGWIEFVLGLKVELIANIYLGASVSLRNRISEKQPGRFNNLFIPGFGRTNDFSKYGVGFNYTISYLVPFYKKKE